MLGFALIGFVARKLDFSFVTFLIGFVIGPKLELSFRQSLQLLKHDASNLLGHPIALVFLFAALVFVVMSGRSSVTRRVQMPPTTQEH
jgi:putative tricarboxylic transport membrane protein